MEKSFLFLAVFAGWLWCAGAADLTVTDFFKNDGKSDVADAIQKVINENPNRTIYFPDGTYVLSKPILTPADPRRSVSLKLSDFAILKAAETWNSPEAMVRLGGSHPYNSISIPGSNYTFSGGIVDGSGVANGISIDSGRETVIRNTSIKHTKIGIHIKKGANNGSSDADIQQVNIYGTGSPDSIGLWVQGLDNTFTNMRICKVQTGVKLESGGNCLRNIHPLYSYTKTSDQDYSSSIAFLDQHGSNWYDYCYSDQYATAFVTRSNAGNIYSRCFCFWYTSRGGMETAFRAEKKFNSSITDFRVGFRKDTKNVLMEVKIPGGTGELVRPMFQPELLKDEGHLPYLKGNVIHLW
ncbi:MAG: hypothetical protein J6R85_02915 [Lentisphaeria bacterium]|nr:hypothetical protein [Lentisphaeria bacterium]